ncbi:hypothetical protein Cgig2_000366 [Carnegiea gigantea]|uniref:Uncharacterized protein n=1 Tax=Carnegiea gigantea TaxID=171969 RepID=A0A9Q1K3F0_9CARY|nr:hypothetical protein Cgig2_000366 [Carnegiea gigantea]
MISLRDINIDKYRSIDMFRDMTSSTRENAVKLPKFLGSRWYPPSRENQSWLLSTDGDYIIEFGAADDEESDYDNSEDSDFRECQSYEFEESESFSLDEKDDLELENESLDDIGLGIDIQLHMTLGHVHINDDVGENILIVKKWLRYPGKASCALEIRMGR